MGHLMSGKKSEVHKMLERLCANRDWLDEHIDDLIAEYDEGDWIAVLNEEVLAKGSTAEECKKALGDKAAPETIILFVPGKEIPQPI